MPPLPPLNYDSPLALRKFLAERGLGAQKKYGQNFLINRDMRNRLLDALEIGEGDRVWEIGPGLGAMTAGLLERGALVTAFEIDRGFIALLEDFFGANPGFTLVAGNVLRTWPQAAAGEYLLGNLPYNIAALLLGDLIEGKRFFKRMVVTVQKEVARRICAPPGSRDYSSLSALCASAYRAYPLRSIPGSCFYPEPRVDSQGVRLDRLAGPVSGGLPGYFVPLIRRLFASRRKMVKNNLRDFILSLPAWNGGEQGAQELSAGLLEKAGIPPEERVERLAWEHFIALARLLAEITPPLGEEEDTHVHP